ncbi:uncharacterized protein LOC112183500 [Rosa chinensis]|uniref:uncharacterized protein LOC112183500 n=1 Tax=Rosa chinensis TaxID=74649 RepID=UPI000D0897B8|nr:uncharacterized protein LOC112183500 [Rosa chinensis]
MVFFLPKKDDNTIARTKVLENVLTSTSQGDPYKELWRRIWKATVPGKVQIYVWRACSNLLPTRAKLSTKGYQGDLQCLLCSHAYEDTSHVFCKCPIATAILTASPFNLGSSLLPSLEFKEWLLDHARNLPNDLFAKLLMILWALWKNRNNMLWNHTKQSAEELVLSSLAWLEEFGKANKINKTALSKPKQAWRPAGYGTWKLNVDGSFLPGIAHGGVRGVLHDDAGQFRAAFAAPIPAVASTRQVELWAIKEGLKLVATMQVSNIIIETDCLEAVSCIAETQFTYVHDEGIIDDIRQELNHRTDISVQHK